MEAEIIPLKVKRIKPKGNKVKPTEKQKRAFKEIIENGCIKKKGIIKAGYSPNTAINPTKVTESKGWLQLLAKHLPDDELNKIHKEGLHATKEEPRIIGRDDNNSPIYQYKKVKDYNTRHKYLVTAYKLKDKFPKDQENNNNIAILVKSY